MNDWVRTELTKKRKLETYPILMNVARSARALVKYGQKPADRAQAKRDLKKALKELAETHMENYN